MAQKKLAVAAIFCLILFVLGSRQADAGLIIHDGSTLILNSAVLDMNCGDTTVNGGGTLDLGSGTVNENRDRIILPGGVLISGSSVTNACRVHVSSVGAMATEGGSEGTYTIQLGSVPSGSVELTATPDSQCVITSANPITVSGTTPQTMTVEAVDDSVLEGNHSCTITHAITSSADPVYPVTYIVDDAVINIIDNDFAPPPVLVTESGGDTRVTEGGASDSYTITLTIIPNGTVTFLLQTSGECAISHDGTPAGETPAYFYLVDLVDTTPLNVTVTAVDDSTVEDFHSCNITQLLYSSTAAEYPAFSYSSTVTAFITDNDPGVILTETTGGIVAVEGGATSTYTINLSSEPASPVTVIPTPDPQVTVSPQTVIFPAGPAARTPQTIIVTAVDDTDYEADHTGTIGHIVESDDPDYNSLTVDDLTVTLIDNDIYAVITQSGGSTDVSEKYLTTDSYQVALPAALDLSVGITTDDQCRIISTNPLVFSAATASVPQNVTVQAVADSMVEASPHPCIVTHNFKGCTENCTNVDNAVLQTLQVNVTDFSLPATVLQSDFRIATESSVDDPDLYGSFILTLSTVPTAPVEITLTPDAQCTVTTPGSEDLATAPGVVTLDGISPRVITVKAVNDSLIEGDHICLISQAITNSSDAGYPLSMPLADISAPLADNPSAPASTVVISSNGGGGTAAITLPENTSAVTTVAATGTPVFSLSGGTDRAKFNIDEESGALTFISPPDYEAPADHDRNNIYEVVVNAVEGVNSDSQIIHVTVTSVNEPPIFTGTPFITGIGQVGHILGLANTATYDVDGDIVSLNYQWAADGIDIPYAISDSYSLTDIVAKAIINCTITAFDGNGGVTAYTTAGIEIKKFPWLMFLPGLLPPAK